MPNPDAFTQAQAQAALWQARATTLLGIVQTVLAIIKKPLAIHDQ